MIPTPAILSLRAVCPVCGASLAAAGEARLRGYAAGCHSIDVFLVGYELQTAGVALSDSEVEAARSLEDLARAVAGRLSPAAGRESRAGELVAEAASRVAPDLLYGAGYAQRVIERSRAWWEGRMAPDAEPGAAPDTAG